MTINPLVVPKIDQPTDIWAGIWIAEDIELIVQGVKSNNWVDTTLGSVGAALDGLAFVSDPGGAVLQYFASWAMEHFKPLTDVLDWLAGDPGAIAGHAQTWRNVGGALHGNVTDLTAALEADVVTWGGTAGPTYKTWAGLQHSAVTGLANACEAMATITECAGYVVGAVRIMVRDLIAIAFSRAVSYLVELGFSGGFAAPLVVEQVSTLALSTGGRIARLLRGLINSLRRLFEAIPQLGRLVEELKQILGRLDKGHPEPPHDQHPPRDPAAEAQRVHDLGMDPATGRFRPGEAETAVRLEQELDVTLTRDPSGSSADWVDEAGRTYDAVGNFPSRYFDQQWPQLQYQIQRHLDKADLVPVDVSQFTPDQVAKVIAFIADNHLGPRVFLVGQ